MSRPARFFIQYDVTRWTDPNAPVEFRYVDAPTKAKAIAEARDYPGGVSVIERLGIFDATPAADPPGLIWDWTDERVVWEA